MASTGWLRALRIPSRLYRRNSTSIPPRWEHPDEEEQLANLRGYDDCAEPRRDPDATNRPACPLSDSSQSCREPTCRRVYSFRSPGSGSRVGIGGRRVQRPGNAFDVAATIGAGRSLRRERAVTDGTLVVIRVCRTRPTDQVFESGEEAHVP